MALSLATWGNSLHSGERTYPIVAQRRRWFVVSALLMALSIGLLFARGINPGIDFTGGSEFVVSGTEGGQIDPAVNAVTSVDPSLDPRATVLGGTSVRVRFVEVTETESREIRDALAAAYDVPTENISSTVIGPTWGGDVSAKALKALIIFLVLVTLVMSMYFRAWRMAAAALIALVHDLVFTIGVYAGVGFEVTPASVIGFLTILGFSLYDTVVVFDKVRENTKEFTSQRRFTYAELANLAINQTLVRSINTSVVALLPVSSILFIGAFVLGAGTLKDIALALFVGLAVGTYSSIFVATPFEVALRGGEDRVKKHTNEVLEARRAAGTDPDSPIPAPRVGALKAGHHQGVQAQPRRKRRP